ncbi:unnamed protein product, partial [Rotaria sp. Silwood2]
MTTTALPTIDPLTNANDANLEIFSLIWLDQNVHAEENQGTQQKLRLIINHLKTFQYEEECEQYIKQRQKHDRLVVIVSRQLARQVVPSIHKLRQVSAIYITSTDEESDEQWAQEYSK